MVVGLDAHFSLNQPLRLSFCLIEFDCCLCLSCYAFYFPFLTTSTQLSRRYPISKNNYNKQRLYCVKTNQISKFGFVLSAFYKRIYQLRFFMQNFSNPNFKTFVQYNFCWLQLLLKTGCIGWVVGWSVFQSQLQVIILDHITRSYSRTYDGVDAKIAAELRWMNMVGCSHA